MENNRDKKMSLLTVEQARKTGRYSRSEFSDDRRFRGCCHYRENFRLRHAARLRRRKDGLARNTSDSGQSTNGSEVNRNAMARRARSTNAAEQSTSGLEVNTNVAVLSSSLGLLARAKSTSA